MPSFTPQQQQALERAYEILGEHFNGSIIAVVADYEADCGHQREATRIYWSGGYIQALGLVHEAVRRMNETNATEEKP